jgi:hypothetical protein
VWGYGRETATCRLAHTVPLGARRRPGPRRCKANARANCTGEILASSDVTRNEIKTFTLNKSGDGYELVGHTETHQFVSCKADADATATFVSVR